MSHPIDQQTRAPRPTTVVILGNDATVAARPATAVQLAHACLRAGFETAIPGSWGDELVATESVRQLAVRGDGGAILCACPHVEAALLAPGDDLASLLVPVVAPPVAAARYLRHVYGDRPLRITYVGRCPAASADASIDVQIAPEAFLRQLAERGIVVADQPTVFDSVLPPDRRRHCSLPGGTPAPSCLWDGERTRTLIEIESEEYKSELAQHLIAHRRALIDLAPRLGCACSGAADATPNASARTSVMTGEPPRAARPLIDAPAGLQLWRPIASRGVSRDVSRNASRDVEHEVPRVVEPLRAAEPLRPIDSPRAKEPPPVTPGETARWMAASATSGETPVYAGGPNASRRPGEQLSAFGRARKRTPSGVFRAYTGHVPTTRSPDGRPLPRAYAAHRKTPASNRAIGQESPCTTSAGHATPRETLTAQPPDTPAERTVVERVQRVAHVMIGSAPIERSPIGGEHLERDPGEKASAEDAPVEGAPVEGAPVEGAPVEVAPGEAPGVVPSADDTVVATDGEPEAGEEERDEAPVRRASATVPTHAGSSGQATAVAVSIVHPRSIERHRQPTAFRLLHPRRPVSLAMGALAIVAAAAVAISAYHSSRTTKGGDVATRAPAGTSALGAARTDAATRPPDATTRPDAPRVTARERAGPAAPVIAAPSPAPRGARAATPTRVSAAAPSRRRSSSAASRPRSRAVSPAPESVFTAPTPTPVAPPVAPSAPTTVRSGDSVGGGRSIFPVVPRATDLPARPAGQRLTIVERDSIQREILLRRARADSLQRRIDSMRARP